MVLLYIIVGILVFLLALTLFFIFPSGRGKKCAAYFAGKPLCAHRGFFDNENIPENSLAAFDGAVKRGFCIELDVHLTSDEKLVVIHDSDTERMCGKSLIIEETDSQTLSLLRLLGTEEKIPSFDEFLSLVDGKVPLIIEVKGTKTNMRICELVAETLDSYKGEYCIESFNPVYVGWWKKHRPGVVRGQLSCRMKKSGNAALRIRDFMLENLLFDFISRPDFVAYDICAGGCFAFRLARALGAYPVAWTVRTSEQLMSAKKHFRSFICERGALGANIHDRL